MWVNAYLSIKTLKLPESTQLLQMASFVQMALLQLWASKAIATPSWQNLGSTPVNVQM